MSDLWTPPGIHTKQKKRTWYSVSTADLRAAFPHSKPEKLEAYYDASGLCVFLTEEVHPPDTRHWLHLSVSREDRSPTWEEILAVKEEFIGEDEEGYMVLPRLSEYVNIHNFCFHVWHCLDGDILPR